MDREELHKEIDLIQACITRMADNSFRLKEWYVSIIAVVSVVLITQECDLALIGCFLLIITTIFWGLDAFYLKMETLYRWKYEWVIQKRPTGTKDYLYDLNPHKKEMWLPNKKDTFSQFLFSKTLKVFYGIIWLMACLLIIGKFIACVF